MQLNEWETEHAGEVSAEQNHQTAMTENAQPLPVSPVTGIGEDPAAAGALLLPQVLPPAEKRKRWSGLRVFAASLSTVLTANRKIQVGTCILGFFILVALIGPLLPLQNPHYFSNDLLQAPSIHHWLGTTKKGEDIFAQLVVGARVSLLIGFVAAGGAMILSVVIGLAAGYAGGLVDDVLSLLINIFLVLPGLPLAVVIASFNPFKGPATIIFVLLLTSWAWNSRVLRAQTLSLRRRDFVEAARAVGETPLRIIFREILPNEIAIVASGFVGNFIYCILADVALEFLGLGDTTGNGWGVMLFWAQNDQALLAGAWWIFLPPGICIALLGSALTFLNYGIDELANPRLRKERVRKPRVRPAGKAA